MVNCIMLSKASQLPMSYFWCMVNFRLTLFGPLRYIAHIICYSIKLMRLKTQFYGMKHVKQQYLWRKNVITACYIKLLCVYMHAVWSCMYTSSCHLNYFMILSNHAYPSELATITWWHPFQSVGWMPSQREQNLQSLVSGRKSALNKSQGWSEKH